MPDLLVRKKIEGERGHIYELTDAGRDLDPINMSLAVWGWKCSRDVETADLDPAFLAWSMHTRLNIDLMPRQRTVLEFAFTGYLKGISRFWLIVEEGSADMCLKYPGCESDLVVHAEIRRFVEAWRGFRDLRQEIADERIRLNGGKEHKQALPDWLILSALAPFPRQVGEEAQIKRGEPECVSSR